MIDLIKLATQEGIGLTYDDVLLVPQSSSVLSRNHVQTFQYIPKPGVRDHWVRKNPIISANMDSITGPAMFHAMREAGGMGVLHRFASDEQRLKDVAAVVGCGPNVPVATSIGINDDIRFIEKLIHRGANLLVVDIAHGDSTWCSKTITRLVDNFEDEVCIIAGNVVTPSGARRLVDAGAHGVKVGIGPGSVCTTRQTTGCGVPQLTAVALVANYFLKTERIIIIADGGIKYSGDIVKAIAAGAHFVMIGGLFAGTLEAATPNRYRGSASASAALDNGKSLYTPEGIERSVEPKGSVKDIVQNLMGGVRSGMSYCGTHDLLMLRGLNNFIRITPNGVLEGLTREL